MAETPGSQAADAADKAAAEAQNAAQAAGEEVKKAASDVADTAKEATEATADAAKQPAAPAPKPAAAGAAKPAVAKPAGAAAAAGAAKPAVPGAAKPATAGATTAARPAAAKKEEEPPPPAPKGVTRREFLNYVWGTSMALFLVQFGGITWFFSMPRFRAGEFGGKIDVRAEEFPATNAAPVANNLGKFWLVQTDAGINTLYKICTHLGCIYPWNEAANRFACPCHGSQFHLNGDWIAGPAPRNLDRFKFEVLDAGGNVIATGSDGQAIPMPAEAATVRVDTGAKILGQSHF
jgi:cytochrome b6-f complex iron-sulfur subunit